MPGEAIGTEVKLVHTAHHRGHFRATKIASAALLGLWLVIGCSWDLRLRGPGFQINTGRTDKRAEREPAKSEARNRFVLFLGNACCQNREPRQHQERAADDHCGTKLPAHEDALLKN